VITALHDIAIIYVNIHMPHVVAILCCPCSVANCFRKGNNISISLSE